MIKAVFWPLSVSRRAKMSHAMSVLLFGIFALLSVAQCAMPNHDELKALKMQCRDQNNLKQEEVEDIKPGQQMDTADQRIKCFIKCILTGVNVMGETGDFNDENISEGLKKYKDHFVACKNVAGADLCDKAFNFRNCIWKQVNEQEETAF